MELWGRGTWRQAMDEIRAAQPRLGLLSMAKEEGHVNQEAQGREQHCYGMTQRAGLVPVPAGVDDLKGVECRMTDLNKQRRKAEKDEE